MSSENPVWLGEYVWEETPLDGGPPKAGPLPAEVLSMFRPQHCLLCGITTANMQTAYTHYESKGHFKKVTHHMREKFNALGSLKTNKEKFQTVVCDICNVELTSRIVYLQHYDGKQHMKNLKKRGFKPPSSEEVALGEIAPPPSDPDVSVKDTPPPPLPKVGDFVCALCNVSTATKAQMHVHNNGSRHMKNVAKLADGELRDFYIKNGNCEPTGNNGTEGGNKDNVSDQNSVQHPGNQQAPNQMADHGGYNGGYGPPGQPMDPSMMQQFPPQMPYGSYPQYPMPYDFSSWGQPNMYPNYSGTGPYNGQYGPGPYGPGPQQYHPYGYQGPPPEFFNQQQGFNPGQQYPGQFPGPQQFNPGQQFNPEQYSAGQQYNQGQYPGQQQQQQQQYNQPDYQNQPHYSENDPRLNNPNQRRHSRNRDSAQEPEVNETPLPEGIRPKSLSVGDFIKQWAQDPNDDRPPGVDGPPGIDKSDDLFGNLSDDLRVFKSGDSDKKLTLDDIDKSKDVGVAVGIKPKRAKKDRKKENISSDDPKTGVAGGADSVSDADDIPGIGASETTADLPPIPGLDFTPVDTKPPIITWSEGNENRTESNADDTAGTVIGMEGITLGGVQPPPPHPFNPPIHFLPPSPDSEPPPSRYPPTKPQPPSTHAPSEDSQSAKQQNSSENTQPLVQSTPENTQPLVQSTATHASANSIDPSLLAQTPNTDSTYQVGSAQSTYSQAPVHYTDPTYQQVTSTPSTYTQAQMPNNESTYQVTSAQPQSYSQPVNAQPMYPQVPNYHTPYISNVPVSYSQVPVANYPSVYPHIPAENSQPYQAPAQAPLPSPPPSQTFPNPTPSLPHTPPPIPPLPTESEKPSNLPVPVTTQSSPVQSTDETTTNPPKEDDLSKSATNKPKINSFFRRAAEKMFKEAKEKKLKEEAKKLEKDTVKIPEPNKKSVKDTIVIVPPSNGPKPVESDNTAPTASKPHAHESVSETDVGSEPGEIIDKTPKTETIVGKSDSGAVSVDTPKPAKTKFDFGSKRSSENRKKRSFRVRRSSASRSRSRSRSPKRRRRRSRSWSPSPEKSPVGYYQRNTFQSYYGNDSGYWRSDRVQYRSYEDWDDSRNDRYERRRPERDEFGRERKWKEEKKKEERKKKKRKSRKRERSSSGSPLPRKASKETKDVGDTKNEPIDVELIPSPPAKHERPSLPESVDHKPVSASLMQRLKGSLPTSIEKPQESYLRKDVPAKLVEKIENTVEIREVLIRPDVDSDEAREVEKEEQEILKKVALIKKKLMEKEDENPVKNKKRKKDKVKRKKKRRKSTSSSDSDSSSSDSSSSSSSSSTSSSSSSSTSSTSEPKSKRIVESLISKLSKQAAAGDAKPFDLSMLPALVKKTKKSEGKKKKKKKDKKKKKKKDKKKAPELPPQVLSTFIDADGAYHCKCCNLTTPSGASFIEHLISEKHKLMYKLISAK